MGSIWQSTRNVILDDTLVHLAFRDVARGAPRGRVMIPCKDVGARYFGAMMSWDGRCVVTFTRRAATCVRCLGRPT